jgi:3'-5' exonuclease
MQHQNLLVFDIETVPDPALHDGNSFPKAPFHVVAAIAVLEAEIETTSDGQEHYHLLDLRCGGQIDASEHDLVAGFFQHIQRLQPRLVSFNGRSFDLPVLKYRAMKHGISARWFYGAANRYDNYSYRYSDENHCDLFDALADFGASKGVKLDDIARTCGLPGKFGVDGSMVAGMVADGRLAEVRDYCETDVLNTYLVYLRYRLLTGHLTRVTHDEAVAQVITYIEAEASERSHLADFMVAWREACGDQFLLSPQEGSGN